MVPIGNTSLLLYRAHTHRWCCSRIRTRISYKIKRLAVYLYWSHSHLISSPQAHQFLALVSFCVIEDPGNPWGLMMRDTFASSRSRGIISITGFRAFDVGVAFFVKPSGFNGDSMTAETALVKPRRHTRLFSPNTNKLTKASREHGYMNQKRHYRSNEAIINNAFCTTSKETLYGMGVKHHVMFAIDISLRKACLTQTTVVQSFEKILN